MASSFLKKRTTVGILAVHYLRIKEHMLDRCLFRKENGQDHATRLDPVLESEGSTSEAKSSDLPNWILRLLTHR